MFIAHWRRSKAPIKHTTLSLVPFSSFTEMRDTYRSVQNFRKMRHPAGLSERKIRSDAMNKIMMVPAGMAWLVFSPLVLFIQILPQRDSQTRVVPAAKAPPDTARPQSPHCG